MIKSSVIFCLVFLNEYLNLEICPVSKYQFTKSIPENLKTRMFRIKGIEAELNKANEFKKIVSQKKLSKETAKKLLNKITKKLEKIKRAVVGSN